MKKKIRIINSGYDNNRYHFTNTYIQYWFDHSIHIYKKRCTINELIEINKLKFKIYE